MAESDEDRVTDRDERQKTYIALLFDGVLIPVIWERSGPRVST